MAFDLSPIDVPPVPAKKLAQTNRNLSLEISSPYGQVPSIAFTRETVLIDGDQLVKRVAFVTETYSADEFVAIVPEYAALLKTIPAALDLLAQRGPDWRKKNPPKADG